MKYVYKKDMNEYHFKVEGSSIYDIIIELDEKDEKIITNCDCI